MKYSEFVQFDPIESVVKLRSADAAAEARRLVQTYVISDRMADQINNLVLPQLQFDSPVDNKGLLVVGNYGTGKSHLMALVSAIAEYPDLSGAVSHPAVAKAAGAVAGRFKVVRAEIGSVTASLRDIICGELEDFLDGIGASYRFPPVSQITNNKDAFHEMMAEFQRVAPDQGLLLVLDELLDYLRSRNEHDLILDLGFLREVGEVCGDTRFRFVAGVQESLFDSGRFHFVADTLRRVKDRFEQVRIVREDVAFVVAQRLLRKDARQQGLIREHLTRFAALYGSMNERMDDFVRLFPVHPAYLETFEHVYVAEKREVLRTLSAAIRRVLHRDVPADEPGLIAYDSYWPTIKDNASFRSIPEIKEVLDKSDVLEARVLHAFTRPQYRPMAIRIIHALSVHRLAQDDIYAPIGATAAELRDDLCLMMTPLPERKAEFLQTLVETVLREITRTVNGQFLSYNQANGQYFLDLKKDIDFDSLIEKKADGLNGDQLDRYYFDALARVMECADQTHRPGFRIWQHEVEWLERKAGRKGYLFFGAPNERSTAQPPREFYLYFLQPFSPPAFTDEKNPDEVLLRLKHPDPEFQGALRQYAAARELAATASGSNKRVFEDKATGCLRTLTAWLQGHMLSAYEVTCQGRTRTLADVVQGNLTGGAGRSSVREIVNVAGSVCLAPHFENRCPEYPTFSVLIMDNNRAQAAQDALRWIGGNLKSKLGTAVLDALKLLDVDRLRPRESLYAKPILEAIGRKPQGQVLNRAELVSSEQEVEYWTRFRLEPEFLVVVLASLVHSGDLTLTLMGAKVDATSIEQLGRLSIADLVAFRHVDRPREVPLGALQELFELLGLPPGLIIDQNAREQGVRTLQAKVQEIVDKVAKAAALVQGGLAFWGRPILTDDEARDWRSRLDEFKAFLESLQPYNTVGKLKGFPHDVAAIQAQRLALGLVAEVDAIGELLRKLGTDSAFLTAAEAVLPSQHPWVADVRKKQGELLARITDPARRASPTLAGEVGQVLATLKAEYQDAYLALHQKARLGATDDKKKEGLTRDPRLLRLRTLAGVDILPAHQLRQVEGAIGSLLSCFSCTKKDLARTPTCPYCHFKPVEEAMSGTAAEALAGMDDTIDRLVTEWSQTLKTNLTDSAVAANLELVRDAGAKKAIKTFLSTGVLPEMIDSAFVRGLQEVLSGLQKVGVEIGELKAALTRGGMPCTVTELKDRFDKHLAGLTRGKEPGKVRIVLE